MKKFILTLALVGIISFPFSTGFSLVTPTQITQDTVTKVATDVNAVALLRSYKIGRQMTWIATIRATGETAPTYSQMMNEGSKLFKNNPEHELIENFVKIDVYVLCNDGGKPGTVGKLIIWENPIAGFNPTNGAIDINVQDQTTASIDAHLVQLNGNSTTLTAQSNFGDRSLSLTDSTGFIDGSALGMNSLTGDFYFGTQVGAAVGNDIDIDTPIDGVFPIGSVLFGLTRNMAVDGSSTTQVFKFGPGGGSFIIDITRITGYIQDGTSMDDGRFGGIAALTYGIVFRINRNGVIENKWNAKTNGELALICASDFGYTIKPPAGTSYGARFRNTYAGSDKHGVAIRLEVGEFIEILIQDDLSDLEVFEIMAQGHIVD